MIPMLAPASSPELPTGEPLVLFFASLGFRACRAEVRNSNEVSDNYSERLVADIVLQNGDKMLCVEQLGTHSLSSPKGPRTQIVWI